MVGDEVKVDGRMRTVLMLAVNGYFTGDIRGAQSFNVQFIRYPDPLP